MTMTTSHCSTPMVQPVALPRPRIFRGLRELIARARRRRREAIQLAHLQSLDDYLLADIGLTRDRVSGIIGDPYLVRWQRPPDLR
jgi:uncharacterized protein YjiS (DUF1127 family)